MYGAAVQPSSQRPAHVDMASVMFTLRPLKPNRIPRWQGRAAQALFYYCLNDIHPEIATFIHDSHGVKPFTISNLIGAQIDNDMMVLHPSQPLQLRITLIHPHMAAIALNGIIPELKKSGFSLHEQQLRVIGIRWLGQMRFDDLLKKAKDVNQLQGTFYAPTAFKRTGGIYVKNPEADLVFKSLYQRWNALALQKLPDALYDSINTNIHLVDSRIQHDVINLARGKKGTIPCFVGQAKYDITEPDSQLRRYIHALGMFAAYSSVGVKTTIGLGRARVA